MLKEEVHNESPVSNARRSRSTPTLRKRHPAFVTKRKISGGTVSDKGRDARDIMLGLAKTCMKLKLSFYESSAPASASQGQKSRPSQASSGQPRINPNVARPGIAPVTRSIP